MRLELYVPTGSPVHRLHPATKLGLLCALITAPFLTPSAPAQLVSLAAAVAIAWAGGVLRAVLAPWKLLLFIFATSLVLWGITSVGWIASAAYALRVTSIFLIGLAFLATTRIEETVHALESFRVPYRLAFALGLAFRLVPLFLVSAGSIATAQRARGLDLSRGGPLERLRKYVPILVPIFMTSLRSADQMAMALEARGFSAGGPRTRLKSYGFGAPDMAALAIGALYFAVFVASARGGLSLVPAG